MNKKRSLSLLLASVMVLSLLAAPLQALAVNDSPALADPGFESADGETLLSWDVTMLTEGYTGGLTGKYSTNAVHGGTGSLEYWTEAEGLIQVSQVLAEVPAGTYVLSGYAMASGDATPSGVTAYFGGLEAVSSTACSGQAWGEWGEFTATYEIAEPLTNVALGVIITSPAGGWGRVDDLSLAYTAPGTEPEVTEPEVTEPPVTEPDVTEPEVTEPEVTEPETPELTEIVLPNGDFEEGTSENWRLTGYTEVAQDQWATNNSSYALSLWLSDSEMAEGSASYTATLTAGTYKFSFDLSGKENTNSNLGYSIYVNGEKLMDGQDSYATGGWDVWETFETAEFTIENTAEVTFCLSGTQPAGYFGDLDNLKLYGTGSLEGKEPEVTEPEVTEPEVTEPEVTEPEVTEPEVTELTKIALPNGDFEEGSSEGWILTGYTEVARDQWATNNSSYALSLWLSDSEMAEGSASYTATLTAGTYKFSFDLSGQENTNSNLGYSIYVNGEKLMDGQDSYATGGWDVWETFETAEFTIENTAEVTFCLSGTQPAGYFGDLDNLKLYGTGSLVVTEPEDPPKPKPTPVDADIYVPYVEGTDGDFMRGMDVSSLYSVLNSGATFKDFEGNTLDGAGFMRLLAANGVNWIRLRVWNDPFDANGNGYGGGNNDVEAAKVMGKWAADAGIRTLIDFHYSDFWADPGKQQVPKAWAGYTADQKAEAITAYTTESINALLAAGVDVGMVQIGNETTNSICGESSWENKAKLFSAGANAVRAIDPDILVAIHFTNPERSGNYANYAKNLDAYGVDYDVFASSYYPYWHGTLENLTSVLKNVANTYGKQVIVAETSWAYTLEDGDGHDNTVRKGNNDSATYPFSVQGQASEIAAVTQALRNVGDAGIGVFYWESAWIPVQVYDGTEETLNENKALWEQYGSGWASSYAAEYDPKDAGVWFGGSAVDNQAVFAFDGTPLESLKTFQYMQTGTNVPLQIESVQDAAQSYTMGDTLALPETVSAVYNTGVSENMAVTWNEADVAAVDMNTPGTYVVNGTVEGGFAVKCTVTVKSLNLLVNPGFEDSDMSMYTISKSYAKRKTDDPKSGKYSLHFYNSGVVDFTAQQTITLEPGHYEFSLYGQGGNVGEGANTYSYVKIGNQTLTADFALTGWAIWANPSIAFTLTEQTEVIVGLNVTATQTGGWGTFDDWYLCAAEEKQHAWSEGTVTKPATLLTEGEQTYTCGVCGIQKIDVLPVLEAPYQDLGSQSNYYYTPLLWCVDNGYMAGYSDTVMAPLATCTRAQVMTILWRYAGAPTPVTAENPFTDVPNDSWYANAVLWAVENQLIAGTGENTFDPTGDCSRAAFVTILWKLMGEPKAESGVNPFTDVAEGKWYTEAILWAVENGIVAGTGATTFSPYGSCSRAQVATILYKVS